jgi:hypothetical protein
MVVQGIRSGGLVQGAVHVQQHTALSLGIVGAREILDTTKHRIGRYYVPKSDYSIVDVPLIFSSQGRRSLRFGTMVSGS